jgi:hypothetical protein
MSLAFGSEPEAGLIGPAISPAVPSPERIGKSG